MDKLLLIQIFLIILIGGAFECIEAKKNKKKKTKWGPGGFDWGEVTEIDKNDRPDSSRYVRLEGHKIKGHSLGRKFRRSPSQCADYCDSLPQCLGFVYKKSSGKCRMKTWNEFTGRQALKVKGKFDIYSKVSSKLECPQGAIRDNMAPRCYKVVKEEKSWNDANARCINAGGNLLILGDEGTRWHVTDLLDEHLGNDDYWLGLRSQKNSIGWELRGRRNRLKKGQGKKYKKLAASKQPKCGVFTAKNGGDMEMKDCDDKMPYVCEFRTQDDVIVNEQCPEDTSGFNGKCYWGVGSKETVEDAEAVCSSRGGTLMNMETLTELKFVACTVWAGLFGENANPWAGARYNSGDKEWQWSSGEKVDDNMFKEGKSNKNQGHCTRGTMSGDTFLLIATPCNHEPSKFICVGESGSITSNQCANHECPENSICEEGLQTAACVCLSGFKAKKSKKRGLVCQATNICQAHGDPHFTTYDRVTYNYQGTCRHLLTGVCEGESSEILPHWDVKINMIRRDGRSKDVSYTEYAEVSVYGHTIRMQKGSKLKVDGEVRTGGFSMEDDMITVNMMSNKEMLLSTDFGLTVKYRDYKADVMVPADYAGKMCGMCGNFDGNSKNDRKQDMGIYMESDFQGVEGCEAPDSEDILENCDPAVMESAQNRCGFINTLTALDECRASENVRLSDFYTDCLEDACAGDLDSVNDQLCLTMDAIVDVCDSEGFEIDHFYRIETNCNMNCGDGSYYNPQMSLDVQTCQNPDGYYEISNGIGEGCQCIPGYLLEGSQCIEINDCGCLISNENIYLEQNTSYVDSTCETKYNCGVNGLLEEKQLEGCGVNAACVPNERGLLHCACNDDLIGNPHELCKGKDDCIHEFDQEEGPVIMKPGESRVLSTCVEIICQKGPFATIKPPSCVENASCQPNEESGFGCECDEGFEGDGEVECKEQSGVGGDPHFMVQSKDSSTRLCYDAHGYNEQVMQLISDPKLGLTVNGQLFEVEGSTKEKPLSFFNKIAVIYSGFEIIASEDGVHVNERLVGLWGSDDNTLIELSPDVAVKIISRHVIEVQGQHFTLQITHAKSIKFGYYLGIYVTHSDGLSGESDGVIGRFIKSQFDVFEDKLQFIDRPDVIPVVPVTRFSHTHGGMIDCWLHKTKRVNDALLGTTDNFMAPFLNYTKF